jgi:hypothetical protein
MGSTCLKKVSEVNEKDYTTDNGEEDDSHLKTTEDVKNIQYFPLRTKEDVGYNVGRADSCKGPLLRYCCRTLSNFGDLN